MTVANISMYGAKHGDHWAGHEEIAEVEEAERVECAAKRLVNEVKVSDLAFH
jgi:hypothetical protein